MADSDGQIGEVMKKMEDDLGAFFVLAGNYKDRDPYSYPDRCMGKWNLKAGLLVGAVDISGNPIGDTPNWEYSDVFAPGSDLPYPSTEEEEEPPYGTSYGKSQMR
jgi:hypothetical protein